ncbi:MAG: TetR family transcriptional regulator [Burkholderiales bacterium]|nr:TetR family transcriptional regulator [Burkholderiales bacterium]
MVVQHRAIQAEDKAARRAAIVAAAEALLAHDPENFASVAEVAAAAGLAKGTVYLYFRTKEEIVLGVHARHSEQLFAELERTLQAHPSDLEPSHVADAFCRFVTDNPLFLHLSAACMSRFQRTIDPDVMLGFRATIASRLAHFGPQIEARMSALAHGQGVQLLQATYAYAVGMWQLFDPAQKHARGFDTRPELAVFNRDFRRDLYVGLLALWRGFLAGGAARSGEPGAPR